MEDLSNLGFCATTLWLALAAAPALAQDVYPSKPIRFIAPFPPGGYTIVLSNNSALNFGSDVWWSALAPTGTPPEIINRLNAEFGRASKLADLQERYAALGIVGAQ